MPLMDRIIFTDFLQLSHSEQLEKIRAIQTLRTGSLEEARIAKGGQTKSAKKNLAKRGVKPKTTPAALTKLLKTLTPAQLAQIKESYGL